eukprot:TRINITY_DN218_c0_g1_i2.p1 TRINITY_DN218_c0_g1~~TRINITY_DN218_c0_g1_i2.p1  ORF type:complete len:366 (+),score=79.94 TRINITY_DN218_c0_g1_i2:314-1411(+)
MVNVTFDDGEWIDVDGGRVWTITFRSKGAYSMNLKFDHFVLPEGLRFCGCLTEKREEVKGAYTHLNNYESQEFGTFPVDGDTITVEYFAPTGTKKPVLDICHIVHGYKKQPALACLGSGFCNINSVCDPQYGGNYSAEIRAGGMLMNGAGNGYCSGSLINSIGNTGRQLFLTAAHCGTSHTAVKFNWRSPSCAGTSCPAGNDIGNVVVLQRFTESDYTIAEILEPIPAAWNLFLAGFNANIQAPTRMGCIHHPSADVQKMAYAYKSGVPDRWSWGGPSTHWRVTSWDEQSTTEGGSSGSPLFNERNQIVGQLHGGSASCFNMGGYDTYGAVFYSWNNGLAPILNPENLATTEVDGINLDFARSMH